MNTDNKTKGKGGFILCFEFFIWNTVGDFSYITGEMLS